jgi:acetolactate synthase I/II/III large subunit
MAVSGRPGPVALPADMLTETAAVGETRRYAVARAHPSPAELHQLNFMLTRAQRPLLMLGGGGWDQSACIDMAAFAEANRLPVTVHALLGQRFRYSVRLNLFRFVSPFVSVLALE